MYVFGKNVYPSYPRFAIGIQGGIVVMDMFPGASGSKNSILFCED